MKKAEALEFAILGTLQAGPAHGYELRKRLSQLLGMFQARTYTAAQLLGAQRGDVNVKEPALDGLGLLDDDRGFFNRRGGVDSRVGHLRDFVL